VTTIINATIGDVIEAVANRYRADVLMCQVTSWTECRFVWTELGDNGTSVGAFMLHEGGELGTLTIEQGKNPLVNSRIAIAHLAEVEHEHPTWNVGEVAAFAQRPKYPTAYASLVNNTYNYVRKGAPPVDYLANRNKRTGMNVDNPDAG
jgi:hypothetical protein